MNNTPIKFIRMALAIFIVLISFAFGLGLLTSPNVSNEASLDFSAKRVAKDIEVISKKPHSIQAPIERAQVRNYLVARLEEMNLNPELFTYDSVQFRTGEIGSITNIYTKIPSDNSSYILLLAHYDSRYEQKVLKDTVFSYGAADNAYGLGIILELTEQALKYKDKWKQGIKIIFSDAEENGMTGIKYALDKDRYLFDNVGCVVNIDARGMCGPALLFETSKGNSKLMELYKEARFPYTYSLATVIYGIIPIYTDFTPLKDFIPGFNFSVIDDLSYYHTDKDNYENINLTSIQHYGEQISPILQEYLLNKKYSDVSYLKSSNNDVAFTIPGLGLFNKSQGHYTVFFIEVLVFLICFICFSLAYKITSIKALLLRSLQLFIYSICLAIFGTLIAYISALIVGDDFNIIGTKYVFFDDIIFIFSLIAIFVLYLCYFRKKAKDKNRYHLKAILTANFVMGILSIVIYIPFKENFFLIMPIAFSSLGVLISKFKYFRWASLLGLSLTCILSSSFIYILYNALTIGSLGIILFLALYYIILIVGLFNCYLYQWKQ